MNPLNPHLVVLPGRDLALVTQMAAQALAFRRRDVRLADRWLDIGTQWLADTVTANMGLDVIPRLTSAPPPYDGEYVSMMIAYRMDYELLGNLLAAVRLLDLNYEAAWTIRLAPHGIELQRTLF